MRNELPHVLQVKASVEGKNVAVALGTLDIAMRRFMPVTVGLPNLVAAGT
jgi:hypothetical protein